MRIIIKYMLRNLLKNRLAGILIIVSLLVCTAVIYLNLNIGRDLIEVSGKIFNDFFGGYELSISAVDGGYITPDDDVFAGKEVFSVRYENGDCTSQHDVSAMIVEADWNIAENRALITLAQGDLSSDSYTAAVTEKKAALYGLAIGDKIEVTVSGATRRYTVSAICSSVGMFTDERRGCIEILTPKTEAHQVDGILLDVDTQAEVMSEEIRERHPEWNVEILGGEFDKEGKQKSIRSILYMMLAMSVVICFYIISSVTTLMIDARMPVTGTFRSVGASRMKMDLLLFAENSAYGILGGVLGVFAGEFLRYLLFAVYYNIDSAQQEVNIRYILLSVGFSLLLLTVITLFSVLRAGKRSIRDNIFRTSAVASEISAPVTITGVLMLAAGIALHMLNKIYDFFYNVSALALVLIGSALMIPYLLKLFSGFFARLAVKRRCGPLYLALRNLSSSRISVSSVILTAMVSALSFVIMLCTTSVTTYFEAYENRYPYDIFVKGISLDAEEYGFVDRLDGVESTTVEYWDYTNMDFEGEATKMCFVMEGGYSYGITYRQDAEAALEDGYLLVDELFAASRGIHTGDTMRFSMPGDASGEFSLLVGGFCDSGIFNSKRATVILTKNDYYTYVEAHPSLIGICLDDSAVQDEFISDLTVKFFVETGENVSVYSKEAYLGRELENTRDAIAIFSTIPFMTAILAVLGLINNQILSFKRKRREYAVLYSVAMNREKLGKLVFEELALTFVFGIIYGCLLGIELMRIVRDIIFSLIAYVDISFDLPRIALIMAATFVILCVAGMIPRKMVSNMKIVEEIQYD